LKMYSLAKGCEMETTEIIQQVQAVQGEITIIEQMANDLVVNSQEGADAASQFVSRVKKAMRQIDSVLEAPKAAAHRTHKMLSDLYQEKMKPLKFAEQIAKNKISAWALAEKRAQEAAARAAAEAESRRREEEAIEVAIALAQQGKAKEAEAALQRPTDVAPAVVESPKVEFARLSTDFGWELIDESRVPREYFVLDTAKISREVRAKGLSAGIPGIRVVEKVRVSSR